MSERPMTNAERAVSRASVPELVMLDLLTRLLLHFDPDDDLALALKRRLDGE